MRYRMQRRMAARSLAGGQHFVIQDERGQDRFVADGSLFAAGNAVTLRDTNGVELLVIHYHLSDAGREYHMVREGKLVAEMRQHYGLSRERFTVRCPEYGDLEVRGDWANHEYTFQREGQVVARVSKHWFSFHDQYGVEIEPGQDDVLILSCAIVIDRINEG